MTAFKLSFKQKVALAYFRNRINFLYRINSKKAADEALDLFTRPYHNYKKPDPALWLKSNVLQMQTGAGKIFGNEWKSGKPGAKKLLVVHGFSGNSRSFAWYISAGISKGYDVYAFDAPAHGKSEGNRLNVSLYSGVIRDITNKYGPFDAYVAHSLGGLSLMLDLHNHSYQHHPKIVLIAPATESTTAADKFFGMLQLKAEIRQVFDESIIEKTGLPITWYSISRIISEVKGDILWIHDKDDFTTPIDDVMPIFNQQPKHVQFHFTKGLGHSGIYRDEKVKKIIKEFL
jgi:pimeloyl-ACP methyl ester carboxylesterase